MSIEPGTYTTLEIDVMRGGLAVAMLLSLETLRMFPPPGDQGPPVGIARLVDLRWVLPPRRWLDRLAYLAVIAYAIDRLTPVALGYLALFLIAHVTIRTSEGVANHGQHLVTVVVLVQLVAAVTWNAASRWDWDHRGYLGATQADTMIWWSIQAIVAVYFTAGVTKLLKTNAGWIQRSPGLLVAASSRLETGGAMLVGGKVKLVPRAERLITGLLAHPTLTRLIFAAGLLTELLAPMGLLDEGALLVVGVALILLHQANGRLLLLAFPTWQVIVLAYLVNVPQLWA